MSIVKHAAGGAGTKGSSLPLAQARSRLSPLGEGPSSSLVQGRPEPHLGGYQGQVSASGLTPSRRLERVAGDVGA